MTLSAWHARPMNLDLQGGIEQIGLFGAASRCRV